MRWRDMRRPGFTLLELLVSLGVIAIITSLVLVSVNSARESTRKMTCISNLRQIGIAIEAYEATYRVLPLNFLETKAGFPFFAFPADYHSAHARLLPFLDEPNLANQLQFGEFKPNYIWSITPLHSPRVFQCPSESNSSLRSFNYRYSMGVRPQPSSFVRGEDERDGAFGRTALGPSPFGLSGRSEVIFVGERSVGSRVKSLTGTSDAGYIERFEDGDGRRDWYSIFHPGEPQSGYFTPNQWTQICAQMLERRPGWRTTGGLWMMGSDAYFNQILPPNSQIPDCGMSMMIAEGIRTARSEHRGSVNASFGDGSVRTIANGIELETWRLLGSIDKEMNPN